MVSVLDLWSWDMYSLPLCAYHSTSHKAEGNYQNIYEIMRMILLKNIYIYKYKIQDHWKILQRKGIQRTHNPSTHHSQDTKTLGGSHCYITPVSHGRTNSSLSSYFLKEHKILKTEQLCPSTQLRCGMPVQGGKKTFLFRDIQSVSAAFTSDVLQPRHRYLC